MPRSPRCQLHGPVWAFAGDVIDVAIAITCVEPLAVERVDLRVYAVNGWRALSRNYEIVSEAWDETVTFEHLLPLAGAQTLPAGTSAFSTKLAVPTNAAPSHVFDQAYAWFGYDAIITTLLVPHRFTFATHVRLPRKPGPRKQITGRSGSYSPAELEVTLATSELAQDELIAGACVAREVGEKRALDVQLELVADLELPWEWTNRWTVASAWITLPAGSSGLAVPFEFQVPNVPPSFKAEKHALKWQFVATPAGRPSHQAVIPVKIVDKRVAHEAPPPTARAPIGEPVVQVFERLARRGWVLDDALAPGRTFANGPIVRLARGETELALGLAFRGDAGMYFVARVGYARLGLGLRGEPSGILRELVTRDLDVGVPVWDRTHHLVARSEDQCRPFARAVVDCLMTVPELGRLARWTDDELVFERRIQGSWLADDQLDVAEHALDRVAFAIEAGRALIEPPDIGEAELAAWHDYASSLGGRLTAGDLAIDGVQSGLPVVIRVQWEAGRPTLVTASVGSPDTAGLDVHSVAFTSARPADDTSSAVARLAWPADVVDLHVADGTVRATRAWHSCAHARALVDMLHVLRRSFDAQTGPFR